MMNKNQSACLLFCLYLSACGGSSDTPAGSSQPNDETSSSSGNITPVPGGSGQSDQTASGGLTPLFLNPLDAATLQLESVSQTMANTSAQFNDFNGRPLTLPPPGASTYNGGIFIQMGGRERFLGGSVGLTLDMVFGTGQGRIAGISMTGPGTQNGLVDFASELVVRVMAVSGSTLGGTITGEYSDRFAFDDQYSEEFIVDATFDASFVNVDGRIGWVGVVEGTIESETDGPESFNGVVHASESWF